MSDSAPCDPDRHPLDLLAEEFAQRVRRGERPSVSDYVRRYPNLAGGLRQVLPPIAMMEKLKRRNTSGGESVAPLKLDKLGDFRIVREIGRGGMGIVYEAWQESLGRHVALKVLSRASLLDPTRLQRFEREARAAAGLHHTNIVPVFGVGQHEGLHYYIMQFIPGRALSDILAELAGKGIPGGPTTHPRETTQTNGAPSKPRQDNGETSAKPQAAAIEMPTRGRRYWSWVANIGKQVAEALQYAHLQGVLHRDIKPANLLLDDRGIVWVTDFGLAKLAELDDVTRTGDVIGTLQYMAPEGLHAQSDARSDVYGLGLTLYELLTLRPAFTESSPAALMRSVSEGHLAPPRKINPHVPRDLETIVMKATSRDPAARYASAGDLADDLANFIHDRPVMARRASLGERAWRWCRRNRAVSALGAMAAACAIAAIVTGWVAYGSTRRALASEASRRSQAEKDKQQAEAARHDAEVARARADANVELSLRSFGEIFDRLAPRETTPSPAQWEIDRGPQRPGPPPPTRQQDANHDAAVLQSVLNFYDRFAQQNSTNQTLEDRAAIAYRRVGDLYLRLGKSKETDAADRRSAQIYQELLAKNPNSTDYQAGFADAAMWVGFGTGDPSAADAQLLARASEFAYRLVQQRPNQPEYEILYARALMREAMSLKEAGKLADAEKTLEQSVGAWDRSHGAPASSRFPGPQATERAGVLAALAEVLWQEKKTEAAQGELRHAFDEMGRPGGPPRSDIERENIASFYDRLAKMAATMGQSDLAADATSRAALSRREKGGIHPDPRGPFDGQPPPRDRPPGPEN